MLITRWARILASMMFAIAFLGCISAAVAAEPPYPPSPIIDGIQWDAAENIVRLAPGGDNWPVTWAEDGSLLTAYGDGRGFKPFVPMKLSMGFARLTGTPPGHLGVNVRSAGEELGQGMQGKKANGLVMIDGRLYAWLFHADRAGGQCQLAWSDDYAKTWQYAGWTFAEFGLMSFVNYGKNYQGARDDYVYMISHDGPLAHQPADRMILARAPKDRLSDRSAYEFFEKRNDDGSARWTRDIGQRGANFSHAGNCLRSSMVYNPGLKRYLYWQQLPNPKISDHGDTRFEGGFGLYDAPEPWGPWTTAYYTPRWDVGPGERAEFPTAWMSPDGRQAWLVFSGDDSFSVRKATFTTAQGKSEPE